MNETDDVPQLVYLRNGLPTEQWWRWQSQITANFIISRRPTISELGININIHGIRVMGRDYVVFFLLWDVKAKDAVDYLTSTKTTIEYTHGDNLPSISCIA